MRAPRDVPKKRRYTQYSKVLTTLFSLFMLPLSGYVVYRCLHLAELAITSGFTGALPYVTAIVGFVEASVTIVLGCYFDNSKKEKIARAQYAAADESMQRDI
jgi:hypothetical protein